MKTLTLPLSALALSASLLVVSTTASAAAPAKSALCIACHGANGISAQDIYPNLAGQKKGYLISSIKAYKDGTRNNALMKPMASLLNDKEIEELAEYYSKMK